MKLRQIETKALGKLLHYRGEFTTEKGFVYEGGTSPLGSGTKHAEGVAEKEEFLSSSSLSITVVKSTLIYLQKKRNLHTQNLHGAVAYDISSKKSYAEEATNSADVSIAVYNEVTGNFNASVVDSTEHLLPYDLNIRFGTVLLLAMMPKISEDEEAKELLEKLSDLGIGSKDIAELEEDDKTEAIRLFAKLSGNIYYRLKKGELYCNLQDADGNLCVEPLERTSFEAGVYNPTAKAAENFHGVGSDKGGFYVFELTMPERKDEDLDDDDEEVVTSRVLSELEKSLVPKRPKWQTKHPVAKEVVKLVTATKDANFPINNILLKGDSGSGKSTVAMQIAEGLKLPYTRIVGSANMEVIDVVGGFMPNTSTACGKTVEELVAGLPNAIDCLLNPKKVLDTLGKKGSSPTEATQALIEAYMEKMQEFANADAGKDFVFVESELVKAIRNGWVCEFQEPTVISQAGVLPALNSILENGTLNLPTGEVLHRHPDTVIIMTMNLDYEGCRPLNESVLDRFAYKRTLNTPDRRTIISRCKKITGCKDDTLISKCYDVLAEVKDYLAGQGYSTANYGCRTLFDWVNVASVLGKPEDAAECTLICETDDLDAQDYIRKLVNRKF